MKKFRVRFALLLLLPILPCVAVIAVIGEGRERLGDIFNLKDWWILSREGSL